MQTLTSFVPLILSKFAGKLVKKTHIHQEYMLTRSKVIIRLRIPHTSLAKLLLSSASGVSCYLKVFLERGKW